MKKTTITKKEFEERFEYWDISRGCYVLSKKYRTELKEFLLTGKSKGLGPISKELQDNEGNGQ